MAAKTHAVRVAQAVAALVHQHVEDASYDLEEVAHLAGLTYRQAEAASRQAQEAAGDDPAIRSVGNLIPAWNWTARYGVGWWVVTSNKPAGVRRRKPAK